MEPAFIPIWLIKRLPGSSHLNLNLNILISCSLLVLLFTLPNTPHRLDSVPHICLFQALLAIPCPGCGVLRSLSAAARLRFAVAWRFNPAGILIWSFFLFEISSRALILWREGLVSRLRPMFKLGENAIIASLMAVWLWRVALLRS